MKSILISLLIALIAQNMAFANAKVIGNGGNSCAFEFARMGRITYEVIAKNDFYKQKLDLKKLDDSINNAAIIVTEGKLYDKNGSTVPAKNDGTGKIYLSQDQWCNNVNNISNKYAIVLHEYLGVSHPGEDLQYQLSGPLYAQTSLTDSDLNTYLFTGSDFKIETINFNHVLQKINQSIIIETKDIKEFFNVIGINESYRYGFRARINCDQGNERVELVSIYANYSAKDKPQWFYTERHPQKYRFNNPSTCLQLSNKAALLRDSGFKIVFGLDSLKIINFY